MFNLSVWDKILNRDEKVEYEFSLGLRYRLFGLLIWSLISIAIVILGFFIIANPTDDNTIYIIIGLAVVLLLLGASFQGSFLNFLMIVAALFVLAFVNRNFSYLIIGIGTGLFLYGLFYYLFYLRVANIYAFTNKRIIIHKGWLSTSLISVEYNRITDVTVREKFIEKLLTNTGDLLIDTAGTSTMEIVLSCVSAPYEKRKKLDQIMDDVLGKNKITANEEI